LYCSLFKPYLVDILVADKLMKPVPLWPYTSITTIVRMDRPLKEQESVISLLRILTSY